jgi:hypothetical protein
MQERLATTVCGAHCVRAVNVPATCVPSYIVTSSAPLTSSAVIVESVMVPAVVDSSASRPAAERADCYQRCFARGGYANVSGSGAY